MKKTLRYIRNICCSFPLNICINKINDNNKIKYMFYFIFLPIELVWFVYFWISGLILNKKKDYRYKLAVVAIIKNEALYLDEWITYYNRICGVEHFYLYNNNSDDNTKTVLKKYEDIGLVTLIDFPGNMRQVDAYNLTIVKYRRCVKYLIVIDADEFLYFDRNKTNNLYMLLNMLLKKPKIGSVGINWCMYGSGHQNSYENKPVIERFVYRGRKENDSNHYIKSIVNPRLTIGFYKAHINRCFPGIHIVNCKGERIVESKTDVVIHEPLRLNHYFTKSKEEYEKKRSRGMADQKGIRDECNFEMYDLNDVFDDSMKQYVSVIKDGLFIKYERN